MTCPLALERLAFHYVDKSCPEPAFSSQAPEVALLDQTIQDFLVSLAAEVWEADDAGNTRSGRFAGDENPVLGASAARPLIETILNDPDGFFEASKGLATLLFQHSPGNASPGVLCLMRLFDPETKRPYAAVIKVRYRDERFVRLLTGDGPQLSVAQIDKMLLREVQKGALTPHPQRSNFDLKVIDKQQAGDPAVYFTERFLGCLTKKSDEHQVKSLAPELSRYAEQRGLEVAPEKFPAVIRALQAQPEVVTTQVLAAQVAGQGLFGEAFDVQDFEQFVEVESNLGELDIPSEKFGRTRSAPRRITYTFQSPPYRGLKISGPPEAFAQLLAHENGQVVFRVEVPPDGFDVDYE